jgi:hypothetical protein
MWHPTSRKDPTNRPWLCHITDEWAFASVFFFSRHLIPQSLPSNLKWLSHFREKPQQHRISHAAQRESRSLGWNSSIRISPFHYIAGQNSSNSLFHRA